MMAKKQKNVAFYRCEKKICQNHLQIHYMNTLQLISDNNPINTTVDIH